MIALVTGAAGFIGSSLVDRLLSIGWQVRGIDSLTDYYSRDTKRSNLSSALLQDDFQFFEADLLTQDLEPLLDNTDVVFHLAGQPGVRPSWGSEFVTYVDQNILATQKLLEACRSSRDIKAIVNSSSSSVYGDQASLPVTESNLPCPTSPYGVTKLAAEGLCTLYRSQFQLPTVSLRYFTVYGPRQRPDMAIHRLFKSAIDGSEFQLNGDGTQRRDFTFVSDVVEANLQVAKALVDGREIKHFYNVGFGATVTMNDLISLVSDLTGHVMRVRKIASAHGDPSATFSDSTSLRNATGWSPEVDLGSGLRLQFAAQQVHSEDR